MKVASCKIRGNQTDILVPAESLVSIVLIVTTTIRAKRFLAWVLWSSNIEGYIRRDSDKQITVIYILLYCEY